MSPRADCQSVQPGTVMLSELTELILPERRAAQKCEACGQEFRCGASLTGCWCWRAELTAAARAQLRARYRDCLCPTCLASWAAGAPAKEASE
jgi:hypothetical protein